MNEIHIFRTYPFRIGDRIHIADGPRAGDWEVTGLTDHKVTLRCPVSGREFTWTRFCYFMETRRDLPWPRG